MNELLTLAIESVNKAMVAYCKSITSNDVGKTGGHQYGFHLHKSSWPLFFEKPSVRGNNQDKYVNIKWQNDFTTQSRFIYYGVGTRDEYRVTRFGKGFPFLGDENVGDLLILCKIDEENYEGYVLTTDEDIENFLATVGISITEINGIIPKGNIVKKEASLEELYNDFIAQLKADFPSGNAMAEKAREIYNSYYKISNKAILENPDNNLIGWLDIEYQLFRAFENNHYADILDRKFENVEELITVSNTILNRRKSRAGKSLENHLAEMFTINELRFEAQAVTEGNKKPDFIFPGAKEYHDLGFAFGKLTFLGAKTTCKDRWRQILNEANRIPHKHLFTLQQGISKNQLDEMKAEGVQLVIPQNYFTFFPKESREDILSLNMFIRIVKSKE